MEVTVTKRIVLILSLLLALCFYLPAGAEETGEEALETIVSSQNEPATEEPISSQEEPASGGNPSPSLHTADHPTHEIQSGEPAYQALGDPNTHRVMTHFDLYCETCQRVVETDVRVSEIEEAHLFIVQHIDPPTCIREGSQTFLCSLCGEQRTEVLPIVDHDWTPWEDADQSADPSCERERVFTRSCQVCGLMETSVVPAGSHQWQPVSYTEATCTEDGSAVRRCTVCGAEEVIPLPAYGHTFVFVDGQDGGRYVCALCGVTQEDSAQHSKSHMYYNNTVTSFGPTTRELIGGSVWNRVTPVDLSKEGVFTYPLVANNQYTVGTATLVNSQEGQQVNYKLNSSKINVHSESLVVYPDLEALKTGENAMSFDFNSAIDLKSYYGDDAHVIVAITLKADYDADSNGVRYFWADQNMIDEMMQMIE